jgi:cytochrome P450
MREMHRFLRGLIGAKRLTPTHDLLSALVSARDTKECRSEDELVAMAWLLLFGGYHNSGSLIATTILALLTHPNHLSAVRAGTLLVDAVTEEALRWNSQSCLQSGVSPHRT